MAFTGDNGVVASASTRSTNGQRSRMRCYIFCVTIVVFILYYYYQYYCTIFQFNGESLFANAIRNQWFKYVLHVPITYRQNFSYNWLRMHRARTDWRAMLAPCSDQMAWGTLKSGWGKADRTSATNSYVSFMDVQSAGEFTRIFIQTRTVDGQEKRIGGDFWRVYFKGPANVAATVFDHKNGTYEAIALLMESGNYSVLAYLDYTLCDGLRDPPENWFRIGNAQGKDQPAGVLGFLDHFIYEPLKAVNIMIKPSKNKSRFGTDAVLNAYINKSVKCERSCRSLWDGHGRWKNNVWSPFLSAKREENRISTSPRSTVREGTLWIFGDSLAVRFHNSLSGKPLCQYTFASCSRSYNWLYPLPGENEQRGKALNDDLDFRPEVVLESIKVVLRDNRMKDGSSLLLLNLGLHYPVSVNFTSFQKLIDDVIVTLLNREEGQGGRARVIWKTTTSIRKERETPPRNLTNWRFFTEPRIRLFDAYAMSAMCNAGIEVLDVFPMSAAYLPGTIDVVHYVNEVFRLAEMQLETHVKDGYESMPVCVK